MRVLGPRVGLNRNRSSEGGRLLDGQLWGFSRPRLHRTLQSRGPGGGFVRLEGLRFLSGPGVGCLGGRSLRGLAGRFGPPIVTHTTRYKTPSTYGVKTNWDPGRSRVKGETPFTPTNTELGLPNPPGILPVHSTTDETVKSLSSLLTSSGVEGGRPLSSTPPGSVGVQRVGTRESGTGSTFGLSLGVPPGRRSTLVPTPHPSPSRDRSLTLGDNPYIPPPPTPYLPLLVEEFPQRVPEEVCWILLFKYE